MVRRSNADAKTGADADADTDAEADAALHRPLTARSVVASLLLGRRPPRATAALLVRWCALFGISESAARVTLTRMVRAGELRADDGTYELAGRVRERQSEQEFALSPSVGAWDGHWRFAILPAGARPAAERVALRRTLEHLRMRPLRDGLWVRPDNLALDTRDADSCTWWSAVPDETARSAELVELFELAEFQRRTRALRDALTLATARLPEEAALADAFVTGAAVAQHLRRDPLMPPGLLPRRWDADALRDAYDSYRIEFGRTVASWARG
jgi:phenylacetic acid degradation operon negative regulatory protein